MKKVKYSVIIPVYNKKEYVEDCIMSVVNQSYRDIEIIVINDGSTDNSLEICTAIASSDSRIVLIDKKNSGVSDTRNLGIDTANGEYILFLDADDIWDKELLSIVDKHIEGQDILWFRSCRDIKLLGPNADSGIKEHSNKGNILKSVVYNQHLIPDCRINFNRVTDYAVKTDIIRNNNVRFDRNVKVGEDKLFNFGMVQYINKLSYIDSCLYYIRTNSNSVMGSHNSKALQINEKMFYSFRDRISLICDEALRTELEKLTKCLGYQVVWNSITSDYCHKDNREKYAVRKQRYQECSKYLYKECVEYLNEYDKFLYRVFNYPFFLMNIIMKVRLFRGGLFYLHRILRLKAIE